MARPWKPCSACKRPIPVGGSYYACSVSTCNRARDPKVFCSIACWDAHLPLMNHRSGVWAEEKRAPSSLHAARQAEATAARSPAQAARNQNSRGASDDEILVVASRLKDYIRARSGFNTSADVLPALSDHLRYLALEAIDAARDDGRRTVKGRDVRKPGS